MSAEDIIDKFESMNKDISVNVTRNIIIYITNTFNQKR